jgi:hypothetical protein
MRRRSAGGSVAQRSSGSIGVLIEDLPQRDEFPQALNAQLDVGLPRRGWLGCRLRDQESAPVPMLDLEGGQDVAGAPR